MTKEAPEIDYSEKTDLGCNECEFKKKNYLHKDEQRQVCPNAANKYGHKVICVMEGIKPTDYYLK